MTNEERENIKAGDVVKDQVGDLWKVIGQHDDKIVCVDEPIDQDPDLPHISLWTSEAFAKLKLVTGAPLAVPAEQ